MSYWGYLRSLGHKNMKTTKEKIEEVAELAALINLYKDQPDNLVAKIWTWHSSLMTEEEHKSSAKYDKDTTTGIPGESKQNMAVSPEFAEYMKRLNRQPGHKSTEELRVAFDKQFRVINILPVWESNRTHEISEQLRKQIFEWFLPHLNSRNLLERFADAYFEFAKTDDGQGGLELCSTKVEFFMFLDEFIESEKDL